MSELKAWRRELNAGLTKFQQKAKKATYYAKRMQTSYTFTEDIEDGDKSDAEKVLVVDEGESESGFLSRPLCTPNAKRPTIQELIHMYREQCNNRTIRLHQSFRIYGKCDSLISIK